jgi:hypothetical protein
MMVVDTHDQRIVLVGAGLLEHLGLATRDLVGRSIFDVLTAASNTPLDHLLTCPKGAIRRFADVRVHMDSAERPRELELREIRSIGTGDCVFVQLLPLGNPTHPQLDVSERAHG